MLTSLLSIPFMTPLETGKAAGEDVFAIKTRLNDVFVVPVEGGYIAIDAGSDAKGLAQGLGMCGIAPAKVSHVFITHADADHISGLGLFPNAALCISKKEISPGSLQSGKPAPLRARAFPEGVGAGRFTFVEGGERHGIGGHEVECVPAPGHTPGSMAYLVDGRFMFTGDALKLSKGQAGVHPFTMDKAQAGKTIDGLLERARRGPTLVFTSHYGVVDGKDVVNGLGK